jgi:hypothetical protein
VRPRFSLRLILLAFALLAVALYVFVVRPTTLANRFVAAVSQQEYEAAGRLMCNEEEAKEWVEMVRPEYSSKPDRVYAEVMPREWQDVWRGQRRILFRLALHSALDGNFVDWTQDTDIVARTRGLEIMRTPVNLNFNFPTGSPDSQPAIINSGEGFYLEDKGPTG